MQEHYRCQMDVTNVDHQLLAPPAALIGDSLAQPSLASIETAEAYLAPKDSYNPKCETSTAGAGALQQSSCRRSSCAVSNSGPACLYLDDQALSFLHSGSAQSLAADHGQTVKLQAGRKGEDSGHFTDAATTAIHHEHVAPLSDWLEPPAGNRPSPQANLPHAGWQPQSPGFQQDLQGPLAVEGGHADLSQGRNLLEKAAVESPRRSDSCCVSVSPSSSSQQILGRQKHFHDYGAFDNTGGAGYERDLDQESFPSITSAGGEEHGPTADNGVQPVMAECDQKKIDNGSLIVLHGADSALGGLGPDANSPINLQSASAVDDGALRPMEMTSSGEHSSHGAQDQVKHFPTLLSLCHSSHLPSRVSCFTRNEYEPQGSQYSAAAHELMHPEQEDWQQLRGLDEPNLHNCTQDNDGTYEDNGGKQQETTHLHTRESDRFQEEESQELATLQLFSAVAQSKPLAAGLYSRMLLGESRDSTMSLSAVTNAISARKSQLRQQPQQQPFQGSAKDTGSLLTGSSLPSTPGPVGQYTPLPTELAKRAFLATMGNSEHDECQKENGESGLSSQDNAAGKRGSGKDGHVGAKVAPTLGQRSSIYRGVTRHRWTGRYEAHLWDNSCRKQGQNKKGRQVYLGGYDKEDAAARAYDLAALKYWGPGTITNFPLSDYATEIEAMENISRQEYIASIRRRSSGFARGASKFRGVTRHHQHGRWEARIGRVLGNKYLYLGTYATQEEAAEAYDIAAVKYRGLNAVTNFELSRYIKGLRNPLVQIDHEASESSLQTSSSQDTASQARGDQQHLLPHHQQQQRQLELEEQQQQQAALHQMHPLSPWGMQLPPGNHFGLPLLPSTLLMPPAGAPYPFDSLPMRGDPHLSFGGALSDSDNLSAMAMAGQSQSEGHGMAYLQGSSPMDGASHAYPPTSSLSIPSDRGGSSPHQIFGASMVGPYGSMEGMPLVGGPSAKHHLPMFAVWGDHQNQMSAA